MNMGNRMYGIVYTSGTFDLFHRNHLELIKRAKSLADYLIVGVSSDELVCQYKNSPSIPFEERIEIIEAIKYVDCTIPSPLFQELPWSQVRNNKKQNPIGRVQALRW